MSFIKSRLAHLEEQRVHHGGIHEADGRLTDREIVKSCVVRHSCFLNF